jgi:hypothetical protein
MVIAGNYTPITLLYSGYIAGSGDGIVTVKGEPASRKIWLLNAQTMAVEQVITSLKNGHYIFLGLNPDKKYLVMVRDYKKEYEPFVWDDVTAANDLTIDEQVALQETWKT